MVWRNAAPRRRAQGDPGAEAAVLLTAAITAAAGWALSADAGQITRPIRDTSSRTVTSTGKVVVAVPHGHRVPRTLHRATRDYFGSPVRCGGVDLHQPHKRLIVRLPTWHRYNTAYDICGDHAKGNRGLSTYRKSDDVKTGGVTPVPSSASPLPSPVKPPITVIAAGPTKFEDLPASMRRDAWTLMENGRYRDAARMLEKDGTDDLSSRAAMAVATAMSGNLDGGADALAELGGDLGALRSLDVPEALANRLVALADNLYQQRPDAQRVLNALADADQPDSA